VCCSIGGTSAVLLANALHKEVTESRRIDVINRHLTKILQIASASNKEAQKLVTAGTVPTLILLLKARAADAIGLEVVLIALGVLAYVLIPFVLAFSCLLFSLKVLDTL
jgi:hypothetical protein